MVSQLIKQASLTSARRTLIESSIYLLV